MGAIFRWVRELWLGLKQIGQTVDSAVVVLPDDATEITDIFEVVGGRVKLTELVGVAVTDIPAFDQTVHLRHETNDLCIGLNINDDAEGTLYTINGDVTDPMEDDGATGVAVASFVENHLVLSPGTIDVHAIGVAGAGGQIQFRIAYIPLDPGAHIIPA